jgi:predicted ribonuclease YlaK
MKKYVVDTNILMNLENLEGLVKYCEGVVTVPVYCIEELDNLKTKEAERGYQARRALRNLDKFSAYIDFYLPQTKEHWYLPDSWDMDKVDNKLVNLVRSLNITGEPAILLSNDLNVRIKCESVDVETAPYYEIVKVTEGYIEVHLNDKQFADFEEGRRNKWDVPLNQYLIIRDEEGHELRGIYKYLEDRDWLEVLPQGLGSMQLGSIFPKDAYQQCTIDSLLEDDFTVITGRPGSGKTLLSLAYCIRQLTSGARSKLIIFANPVKTRGAEQLGFYPGSRTEKLMQNSVGAMLSSKLGDEVGADMMDLNIEVLPVSDIRGFEVKANEIMYITEAQNLSIDLLKLAVQRCAEGSKIILEGDPCTQVDHYSFEGSNNGLRRVIEVFEGYYGFSHVNLPNIYRSAIADKAEEM